MYVDPNTVHDPATGLSPPAAWGDVLRDDFEWFARNKPRCRAYNTGDLLIPNATWTVVPLGNERYDVGPCHSTSALQSRFTAPVDGLYPMGASATFETYAVNDRALGILLNGTTFIARQITAGAATVTTDLTVHTEWELSAGDFVEMAVYQNRGGGAYLLGSANVNATGHSPEMWMHWEALKS